MSQKLRDTCTAIGGAYSEEQVVSAVKHYVASLTPHEATSMPQAITALGLGHPQSLVQAALHVAQHGLHGRQDVAEHALIKDAVVVLATAAQRLALLSAFHTADTDSGMEQRLQ